VRIAERKTRLVSKASKTKAVSLEGAETLVDAHDFPEADIGAGDAETLQFPSAIFGDAIGGVG
jgi:hypothetical protein